MINIKITINKTNWREWQKNIRTNKIIKNIRRAINRNRSIKKSSDRIKQAGTKIVKNEIKIIGRIVVKIVRIRAEK
jgi:hypothetical protein